MKLLIGYDGSQCATEAIDDVRRAGLPSDGVEAVVLSLADLLPTVASQDLHANYPAALKLARQHAQQALDEARRLSEEGAARVRDLFPQWRVQAESAADSPYWGLVTKAGEWRADLLVVGSHGRSALGRLALGSVSHHAVLYAPCSTRVGRCGEGRDAIAARAPVRIIIGWDGSSGAASAVKAAAARQWPPGSQARLVTALDVRLVSALPGFVPGEVISSGYAAAMQDESDALREGARAAGEMLRAARLDVAEPMLREGDPKRVLIDEAKAWAADCIFVGARGLSRIERVLLGSVSGTVAARASCSVEVIRAQPAA